MTFRPTFAGDVRPGDVLAIATGHVRVVEAHLSHGGVEWLVCPHPTRKGDGATRLLWSYPSQEVGCDASARILPSPTLRERPARPLTGAAARRAVQ